MRLSQNLHISTAMQSSFESQQQAHAKINLYLHVTGKRADGYHLLDSLAVFAQACDQIELAYTDHTTDLSLDLYGPFAGPLKEAASESPHNNLVFKTAHALSDSWKKKTGETLPFKGLAFRLHKNLPVSSGIGGGSADAAAALRLLVAYWNLQERVSAAFLDEVALRLGADVPVCLHQKAARMQGIGEVLRPAPRLPECGLVLVNPGKAVSTPEIFKARTGGFTPLAVLPPSWATLEEMIGTLHSLSNDLQSVAEKIEPLISEVLHALSQTPHQRFVRMSGSGATCFALYETQVQAKDAARILQKNHSNWWVWSGGLLNYG